MAIELINIGRIANDGTGDDLREAMFKINQNFETLDLANDENITATNTGVSGEGLFSVRINDQLQFKKIAAGDGIALISDSEKVTISNIATFSILTNEGNVQVGNNTQFIVEGGAGISTSIVGGKLVITNQYLAELAEDTSPELSGNLDANNFDIINVGNITGLVNGVDPAAYSLYFENIELGGIIPEINSTVDFLALTTNVDMGTFLNPASFNINEGSI